MKTWEFLLLAGGVLTLVPHAEWHSCLLLGVLSMISVLVLPLFWLGLMYLPSLSSEGRRGFLYSAISPFSSLLEE